MKSRITVLGAGLLGAGILVAPAGADTIAVRAGALTLRVDAAGAASLNIDGFTFVTLADFSGSFAVMTGGSDVLAVPDEPVGGDIVVGLGGGFTGSTEIGAPNTGLAGAIDTNMPIGNDDPAVVGVPLPGAGAMGLAGLLGIAAARGRRRR